MSLIIRHAEALDLPALHLLYQQLHPADTTTTIEEMSEAFATRCAHPGCEVFVADQDDRVVGTFVLYRLPNMSFNARSMAILENIIVDEALRGQGIGRAMLEYARATAQAHGCLQLSLSSNARRTDAHEFYRRCGLAQHVNFRYKF